MPKKAPRGNLPQPPRPRPLAQQQRAGLNRATQAGNRQQFLGNHPGVQQHLNRVQGMQQAQQRPNPMPQPPVPGMPGGNMAQQMMGQFGPPDQQMPMGGFQDAFGGMGGMGGGNLGGGSGGMMGYGQQPMGGQMALQEKLRQQMQMGGGGGMGPFGMAGGNMGNYGMGMLGGNTQYNPNWMQGNTGINPRSGSDNFAFNPPGGFGPNPRKGGNDVNNLGGMMNQLGQMGVGGMAGGNMGSGFGGNFGGPNPRKGGMDTMGYTPQNAMGGQLRDMMGGMGMAGGNMGANFGQAGGAAQGAQQQMRQGLGGLMGQVNPGMQNVLQNRLTQNQQRRQAAGRPYMPPGGGGFI